MFQTNQAIKQVRMLKTRYYLAELKNVQLVASSSLIPMKWATSAMLIVVYAEVNSSNILFL